MKEGGYDNLNNKNPLKNNLEYIRVRIFGIDHSEEFAEFLGVNYKTYSAYETGRINPRLPEALRISEKIGLPLESIWQFEE